MATYTVILSPVYHKERQWVNSEVLPKMKQHLELKAYSQSTIRTYLNEMGQFLQAIKSSSLYHGADKRLFAVLLCYTAPE